LLNETHDLHFQYQPV